MYREKKYNESLDIINKEPIDVLIKYIDLSDPNLKREGIKQIKKDEDNGEIKVVDKLAASLILQSYLDRSNNGK